VKKFCRAVNPEQLPIKRARPKTKQLIENHVFVFRKNKLLLQPAFQRWRGMWILPEIKSSSRTKRPIHVSIFPFTNHRVTLKVFQQRQGKIDRQRWFALRALDSIPIPSPHRRAIVDLLH
jgi:hypothetical protein